MKKLLYLFLLLIPFVTVQSQVTDPVTLMLAFQKKYAESTRFSGQVRWNRQNGDSYTGKFVVEGEQFQIKWQDGELRSDGKYLWEIMTRSKRIKKHFYDPLLAPGVVNAFRFVRLDLMAEVVRIGGTLDRIAIDVDFGSSVVQGSHIFCIDQKTFSPLSIMLMVDQEGYYEKADFAEVRAGDQAAQGEYTVDFATFKKDGYTLTDMAKGESDAIWPEERALK